MNNIPLTLLITIGLWIIALLYYYLIFKRYCFNQEAKKDGN